MVLSCPKAHDNVTSPQQTRDPACAAAGSAFTAARTAAIVTMAASEGSQPAPTLTAVKILRPAEGVAVVEMHRPEKLNALNDDLWK